jgi:hypothetical protein
MTYHIDQLGQVVQEVPEPKPRERQTINGIAYSYHYRPCGGCLYSNYKGDNDHLANCRSNQRPLESVCARDKIIYILVETT